MIKTLLPQSILRDRRNVRSAAGKAYKKGYQGIAYAIGLLSSRDQGRYIDSISFKYFDREKNTEHEISIGVDHEMRKAGNVFQDFLDQLFTLPQSEVRGIDQSLCSLSVGFRILRQKGIALEENKLGASISYMPFEDAEERREYLHPEVRKAIQFFSENGRECLADVTAILARPQWQVIKQVVFSYHDNLKNLEVITGKNMSADYASGVVSALLADEHLWIGRLGRHTALEQLSTLPYVWKELGESEQEVYEEFAEQFLIRFDKNPEIIQSDRFGLILLVSDTSVEII